MTTYPNSDVPVSIPVNPSGPAPVCCANRGTVAMNAYLVISAKQLRAMARRAAKLEAAAGGVNQCIIIRNIRLHVFSQHTGVQVESGSVTEANNMEAA